MSLGSVVWHVRVLPVQKQLSVCRLHSLRCLSGVNDDFGAQSCWLILLFLLLIIQSARWPKRAGGRVAEGYEGVSVVSLCPLPETFFEFSSKNCRVLCILFRKTTCGKYNRTVGLSRPLGGWRCEMLGNGKVSTGLTLPPANSHPAVSLLEILFLYECV